MKKINIVEIVRHSFNGNVEDVKFVEVDGKKFEADEKGEAKKDSGGNPIPFVEKQENPTDIKVGEASLEELAKTNPHVARMLEEKTKVEKDLADKMSEESLQRQKDLEKAGEWQKLAEERAKEIERLTKENGNKDEMLGKYKGSVEAVLKEVMATIPKEKLSLIPEDFSPRQKLEYITKNAKQLGAKVSGGDNKIDKNDDNPVVTDEEKLVNEIVELQKKSPRTAIEDKLMFEKATALKALRANKK